VIRRRLSGHPGMQNSAFASGERRASLRPDISGALSARMGSVMDAGHARAWLRIIGFCALVAPFLAPFIREPGRAI